jgi:YesN/AraC family two-component response regulator
MKPVRVLLVDDHKLVRAGIRALLDKLAGVEVVAEADNGSQAIQMIRLHSPDVVITDLLMPVMNGIELTAHASKEYPQVRVLIVSEYTDEFYVLQALPALKNEAARNQ